MKNKSILKELYYGNITPWCRPFVKESEYAKHIRILADTEEKLISLLNETEKDLLEKFTKAQSDINEISVADNFVDGFCLGMRMAMEVFEKSFESI